MDAGILQMYSLVVLTPSFFGCNSQEAHDKGVAMVVAVAQDVAEAYTEGLRSNGLVASMEPGC